MDNLQNDQSVKPVPKWFKVFNAVVITLVLSCSGYIVVNNIGNTYKTTSGAGEIWWASTPEVIQSYQSIMEKKQKYSEQHNF